MHMTRGAHWTPTRKLSETKAELYYSAPVLGRHAEGHGAGEGEGRQEGSTTRHGWGVVQRLRAPAQGGEPSL